MSMDQSKYSPFIAVAALFLSIAISNLQLGDAVLRDPFHHGEHFAALSSILNKVEFIPITVHGALDYIPALMSIAVYGKGEYFFGTLLFYRMFEIGSAVTMLFLLSLFIKSSYQLVAAAFIIPFFVGYRDFSLLVLLASYLSIVKMMPSPKRTAFLLLLGVVAAFNFFWSTNRGVAGTASIGLALVLLSIRDRSYLIAIASFLISVILASLIIPQLSLGAYLENILILSRTSGQWSYELAGEPLMLTVIIAVILLVPNVLIVSLCLRTEPNWTDVVNATCLGLVSLFYFQMSTYRADMGHIYQGLMVALICVTYLSSYSVRKNAAFHIWEKFALGLLVLTTAYLAFEYRDIAIAALAIYMLIALAIRSDTFSEGLAAWGGTLAMGAILGVLSNKIINSYQNGSYNWLPYVYSPPSNGVLAEPSMNWVANQLTENNASCVFDMSNNGIINGLSGLPACSRFSYLVYANQNYEYELLESLEKQLPSVIVSYSDFWSYSIDGRPMSSRLPKVENFIQEHYPKQVCNLGYCVRFRKSV